MEHELKCWPEYFGAILSGKKQFEVRLNDRDFKAGDTLKLLEFDPISKQYTGRCEIRVVSYIMRDSDLFGLSALQPGYVIMSIG